MLARTTSGVDYGAFSLAFNIFLVISSLHSALIIEPMSVLGPARHAEDLVNYLRRVISVHFGIFLALAIISLLISLLYRIRLSLRRCWQCRSVLL